MTSDMHSFISGPFSGGEVNRVLLLDVKLTPDQTDIGRGHYMIITCLKIFEKV